MKMLYSKPFRHQLLTVFVSVSVFVFVFVFAFILTPVRHDWSLKQLTKQTPPYSDDPRDVAEFDSHAPQIWNLAKPGAAPTNILMVWKKWISETKRHRLPRYDITEKVFMIAFCGQPILCLEAETFLILELKVTMRIYSMEWRGKLRH